MTPARVQLSRRRGFRLPDNTVSVARPHAWGNSFRIGQDTLGRLVVRNGAEKAVGYALNMPEARRIAVDLHARSITPERAHRARVELAGKNLACWCPLDQSCHADTLLKIANGEPT